MIESDQTQKTAKRQLFRFFDVLDLERGEEVKKVINLGLSTLAIVSLVLMGVGVEISGANVGAILLALETAYLIFSYGTVGVDEVAARFVLGAPDGNLDPGPYLAPLGLVTVRKGRRTRYQDELPGEPRQIFRQDDKLPVPPNMFPPIRVKFGSPRADDDAALKKDPYNIQIVAEVVPVVSWKIINATKFFKSYDDVDAFRKILEDKAVELFGIEFSDKTPAKALLTIAKTNKKLRVKIDVATANTGVQIVDAFVKPFIFSHPLNTSVVEVSIARQKAEAVKATAVGEKQKRMEEGIGAAQARRLMLEAEAVGVAKLAEISKTPEGQATLWMETMAKAFTGADYSIVPGSEMFTAFAGIKEMLTKVNKPTGVTP